jgi:hypothetical protein
MLGCLKFAANQRTIDKLEAAKVPRLASFLGVPTLRSAEMVTSSLHSEQREWSGNQRLQCAYWKKILRLLEVNGHVGQLCTLHVKDSTATLRFGI